jgi:hypothetical protein
VSCSTRTAAHVQRMQAAWMLTPGAYGGLGADEAIRAIGGSDPHAPCSSRDDQAGGNAPSAGARGATAARAGDAEREEEVDATAAGATARRVEMHCMSLKRREPSVDWSDARHTRNQRTGGEDGHCDHTGGDGSGQHRCRGGWPRAARRRTLTPRGRRRGGVACGPPCSRLPVHRGACAPRPSAPPVLLIVRPRPHGTRHARI